MHLHPSFLNGVPSFFPFFLFFLPLSQHPEFIMNTDSFLDSLPLHFRQIGSEMDDLPGELLAASQDTSNGSQEEQLNEDDDRKTANEVGQTPNMDVDIEFSQEGTLDWLPDPSQGSWRSLILTSIKKPGDGDDKENDVDERVASNYLHATC